MERSSAVNFLIGLLFMLIYVRVSDFVYLY